MGTEDTGTIMPLENLSSAPPCVLFEDEHLLVVNKPAGWNTHAPSPFAGEGIYDWLKHREPRWALLAIIHRLDKETSGCLVVAKNDETHVALSAQFAGRTVEKTYLAIVCGELPRDQGEIRAAIARHPTHRKRMAVRDEDEGREAHTSYRVLERLRESTLVEARLHTGRTHQIRVHFQHLGHPVAGDTTYGQRQTKRLAELTKYEAPRVLLHAHQLGFIHPRSGKPLHFEAPWPEDFTDATRFLAPS